MTRRERFLIWSLEVFIIAVLMLTLWLKQAGVI